MTDAQTIDSALRFIPSDDRGIWILVGMAIKATLGDNGFSLFDCWSQTGQSYNERDTQQVWRSFRDGTVQIGTLFHIAQQHGYRTGRRAPPRPIPEKKAPSPQQTNTGKYAAEIWLRADCSDNAISYHPYAIRKGIDWAASVGRATASGRVIGKNADCIVVPIRDITTNKVVAVQCISATGDKQTFGRISGYGLVLGNTLDKSLYWCVCEGWATGVSMVFHHLNGNGVAAIAFGKSNMNVLAQTLAEIYQPEKIRVLGEYDA